MKKWEYEIISLSEDSDDAFILDALNSTGRLGWELCGMVQYRAWVRYIFKREKK